MAYVMAFFTFTLPCFFSQNSLFAGVSFFLSFFLSFLSFFTTTQLS